MRRADTFIAMQRSWCFRASDRARTSRPRASGASNRRSTSEPLTRVIASSPVESDRADPSGTRPHSHGRRVTRANPVATDGSSSSRYTGLFFAVRPPRKRALRTIRRETSPSFSRPFRNVLRSFLRDDGDRERQSSDQDEHLGLLVHRFRGPGKVIRRGPQPVDGHGNHRSDQLLAAGKRALATRLAISSVGSARSSSTLLTSIHSSETSVGPSSDIRTSSLLLGFDSGRSFPPAPRIRARDISRVVRGHGCIHDRSRLVVGAA